MNRETRLPANIEPDKFTDSIEFNSAQRDLLTIDSSYSFLALLRVINKWLAHKRLGHSASADHGVLVITHHPTMESASSELHISHVDSTRALQGQDRIIVAIKRMGMFAPIGILPIDYTEHAILEEKHFKSTAFRDFVNLGLSRLSILDYSAWARLHPSVSAERPTEDRFKNKILNLAGLNSEHGHPPVNIASRVAYPSAYIGHRRSAVHLEAIMASVLNLPVHVEERFAQWVELEQSSQTGLGSGTVRSMTLGSRIYDREFSIGIRIGPVDQDQMRAMFDDRNLVDALTDLVRDFLQGRFKARIFLVVQVKKGQGGKFGIGRLSRDWLHPKQNKLDSVLYMKV